jgi:phosphorylase kinase alpha/beta subunit
VNSPDTIAHNREIASLMRRVYGPDDLREIRSQLDRHAVLRFPVLPSGLFPAASGTAAASGYQSVWVRDNVFVAYAHLVNGRSDIAGRAVRALEAYFTRHLHRFRNIIEGRETPGDPAQRPHVRFDGERLEELTGRWAHAQNDALGYFLWLFSMLGRSGLLEWTRGDADLALTLVDYFAAIRFWQDEDSGHWEEDRKVSASSIGVVVGGLRELRRLGRDRRGTARAPDRDAFDRIDRLIASGTAALDAILPNECIQDAHRRPHDAALLFLIHPVGVVGQKMADRILDGVVEHLQGDYGIRRYRGDSYWCADYKSHLDPENRTRDFSTDIESRNRLLRPGQEAQWCIFDPVVSTIYGERFGRTREERDLELQVHYLNRALGQITGTASDVPAFRCPEAYYLENGTYVPNDHTPLLWTEANLWVALHGLEQNLGEA